MSWKNQTPVPSTTSKNTSWALEKASQTTESDASWALEKATRETPTDASSWAWKEPSAIKSASWTWQDQKDNANAATKNSSWADAPPLVETPMSVPSWGSIPATGPPRVHNSWSDRPARRKRSRDPNAPYTIDDQINDMLDAFEDGDDALGHINQEELLAKITMDQKKEATRATVDGIEKSFVGYFIMMGGIFNAFRDSMPTVFPAAFFGDEVYQKAQQTGNEINDEITNFIAGGKARGATKQLLEAMAAYGDHDPQYANMRRAFAKAERRDKNKSEKQQIDEQQSNFGGIISDTILELNLNHYPPKVMQLFDYGMKSFFISEFSIGSFITRTETAFIPFVQTLRPNVGFLLHLMNFLPEISTPSEMLGFLVKKAAHWVDPDNEHLEPFFNSVFNAVYPVLQPILSFLLLLLNLFKPAMKMLLDRSHIVAGFTDRILKYVMVLAGMIWAVFAGIVHFIVKLVLVIVQLVLQVVLSIYASPWVGELVNILLTIVTSLV
jgi:hypothetical protein